MAVRPPVLPRVLLHRELQREERVAQARVVAGPLPELLDQLRALELAELLQELGAPPQAVQRELARLRAEQDQDQARQRVPPTER